MDNVKKIVAFDGQHISEDATLNKMYDTEIIFRNPDTKEVIFKTKNKVVLAGGDMVARKLFDVPTTDIGVIPSYNQELGIPDPGTEDPGATYDTSAVENDPKVLLFCVGTDGCGTEGSQVYAVDYNSRIKPESIVPFRYPMLSNDLNLDLQESYVGRKEDGDYVAYYFKRFASGPTLIRRYIDGTTIEGNVYETGLDVDCYIELTLMITKEDLREFFIATTGIDECRFNTLSLCYAYPRQVNGVVHYMDIKPLTKLNISNEYMIDVTKGVEVIYHIYF